MSNYYGVGRTNTFRVKDVAALREALDRGEFLVEECPHAGVGAVMIVVNDGDGIGSWSQLIYRDEGDDEPEELFVPDIIAEHLQDGQVAVFQHAGSEKKRYVSGSSIAVHSSGQRVVVDNDHIYAMAAAAFNVVESQIDWAAG